MTTYILRIFKESVFSPITNFKTNSFLITPCVFLRFSAFFVFFNFSGIQESNFHMHILVLRQKRLILVGFCTLIFQKLQISSNYSYIWPLFSGYAAVLQMLPVVQALELFQADTSSAHLKLI